MYDTFFQQDAWCYWVISIAALLSFVGFIVACICSCRHNENKSEFLGLPGMVTMTRVENEVFDHQPSVDYSQIVALDAVDSGKRTSTANRSLPDIPKDRNIGIGDGGLESTPQDVIYEAAEIMGDPSELYATVQDKNVNRNDRGTRTSSQESSSLQEDDSAYPYARLNTLNSANDEHPYAQVQNIKPEVNRQNSFRSNPSQLPDVLAGPSAACTNPIAPPRARRSSSHNSLLSPESPDSPSIQAATAISGGIQANQDLPYMTPPLLSLPRFPQPQPPTHPHFSGDSQDSKGYTSISVREPLANIIAQTKSAQQNRARTDPHYATVSDDSDEMYAAIDEQEKIYTSGSETYAQIQPMEPSSTRANPDPPQNLQSASRVDENPMQCPAPQPPSVDSLRQMAHAHSRQASSSSATSSIINPGSPKPEKRQANSPLPPPPPPLPQADETPDVYAIIEKMDKSEKTDKLDKADKLAKFEKIDKTRNDDGKHLDVSIGKSLEDMYAKVMKKKRDSEDDNQGSFLDSAGPANAGVSRTLTPMNCQASCSPGTEHRPKKQTILSVMEISRASWSSHDSVEIHKKDPEPRSDVSADFPEPLNMDSIEFAKVARIYELDTTPEYSFEDLGGLEVGNGPDDPNYEMLRPQSLKERNGVDVLPFYSVPFKHRQVSNASSDDPGYEKVRLRRRDDDADSEPNYESMPHDPEPNYAFVCRGDSDTDPNYESVSHSDPNYESVRYIGEAEPEPPYERVSDQKRKSGVYERVRNNRDPDYEKVEKDCVECNSTDDEQYVQV